MKIDDLTRRPAAYSTEDGIAELMFGLYMAVCSAAWALPLLQPKGSTSAQAFMWTAMIAGIAATIGLGWGRSKLKSSLVYPRGGYVALAEPAVRGFSVRRLLVFLIMMVSLGFTVFALWIWQGSVPGNLLVAGLPAIVGVSYIASALQYRRGYMYWTGGALLIVALCFWRISSGREDLAESGVAVGMVLAASGALRLQSFLKNHPKPAEGVE